MKILFSLNTDITNTLSTRYDVFEVVMTQYFLAIMRAKKYYPDSEIILYTDSVGEFLFQDICTIKPLTKPKEMYFSESKIEAIQNEETPFIYIDGDLFLNGPLRYHDNISLLIDHDETNIFESHYEKMYKAFTKAGIKEIFPEWNKVKHIFNVGILGIFDSKLKSEYVELFYKLKDWHQENKQDLPTFHLVTLIIVQYSLSLLARNKGYNYEFADRRNDYLHLYGKQKFFKKNITWILEECKTYPEWNTFIEKLDNYDKNSLVFRYFTHYE